MTVFIQEAMSCCNILSIYYSMCKLGGECEMYSVFKSS